MIMRFVLAAIFFILALIFITIGIDKIRVWKEAKHRDSKVKTEFVIGIVCIGLAIAQSAIIIPIIFRM